MRQLYNEDFDHPSSCPASARKTSVEDKLGAKAGEDLFQSLATVSGPALPLAPRFVYLSANMYVRTSLLFRI